jgi:hypothetical protein
VVKKNDDDEKMARLVRELIDDVGEDRNRLSDFLDTLLGSEGVDPEHVAKIAAELTRQNQVKVATIKALGKALAEPDDDDNEFSEEIGRPFPEEEVGEDQN